MGQKESNLRRIEQFVNGDPQYNFGGEAPGFLSYPTPTPSITSTPTLTQTIGFIPTQTPTLSNTPTLTATPTLTSTQTPTPTTTLTNTPTPTLSNTPTLTATPTLTPTLNPISPPDFLQITSSQLYINGTYQPTTYPAYAEKPTGAEINYELKCLLNNSFWYVSGTGPLGDYYNTIAILDTDNVNYKYYNWQYKTNYSYSCNVSLGNGFQSWNIPIPKVLGTDGNYYPSEGTFYNATYTQYITITYTYSI